MSVSFPTSLLGSNAIESDWKYYLARPFSLFGASVWNEWYASERMHEVLGYRLIDAVFVEMRSDIVRNYRKENQLGSLQVVIDDLLGDPIRALPALERGVRLNLEAKEKLETERSLSFREEVDFLIDMAVHSTIIPYFLSETKNEKVLALCTDLRSESFYPTFISTIVEPLASKELRVCGFENAENVVPLVTIRELLAKEFADVVERIRGREEGKRFVYQNRDGKELVEWTENPDEIVSILEKHEHPDDLRGSVAFSGKISGRARVILTADIEEVEFDEGDILVAVSTSPVLLPLIRKASAIVTDEGGMMCHAAILARELEIPCIVGVQAATSRIADGDVVEVDAESGRIHVLTSGNSQ